MTSKIATIDRALGFLTVVEDPHHGLFGGYLVLNHAGRPLEFHCTAPVRPSRAQEILYGPTLRPYLYGEQIGRTLFDQAKSKPVVILTDCRPVMAVADFISTPVALIEPETASQGDRDLRLLEVASRRLAMAASASATDEQAIVQGIGAAAASLDLAEPFERIRAAINEARPGRQRAA